MGQPRFADSDYAQQLGQPRTTKVLYLYERGGAKPASIVRRRRSAREAAPIVQVRIEHFDVEFFHEIRPSGRFPA